MQVLLIGKYLPLQGGVSAACHHAALEACALGHKVHIVTNSAEAVPTNRVGLFPKISDYNSSIVVHQLTPLSDRAFVPWHQPHLSLLSGIALRTAKEVQPNCVIGWYMEPYGLAATLVAKLLDLPLGLVHAGSDVGRLAKNQDLFAAYSAAFQSCQYVVTDRDTATRALAPFNLREEQIVEATWRPVARPSLRSKPKDRDAYLSKLLCGFDYKAFYSGCGAQFRDLLERFEPSVALLTEETPIVAMLGKIHRAKGYFHLVPALDRLLETTALRFRFLLNLSGDEEHVSNLLTFIETRYPRVADVTIALPILHPQLVPDLLHYCDIVCCLDHEFPYFPHYPRIVREAMAAETAVVCSHESYSKSVPLQNLANCEVCEIVQDPSNSQELSGALQSLLNDRNLLRRRQINARQVSEIIETRRAASGPIVQLIEAFENGSAAPQGHTGYGRERVELNDPSSSDA